MNEPRVIHLRSIHDTIAFGKYIGRNARPGDVITLEGELGSGKTTLTQAIGKGLEIPADYYITSPTFALMHEYPGRIPLYHLDLYRLGGEEEIEDLGFDEYLYGKGQGLTVIEWPDRLGSLMPGNRLHIKLTYSDELHTDARVAFLTVYGDINPRLARVADTELKAAE